MGRIAALDIGERRIGIAVSDASCTLARPVGVLDVGGLGQGGFGRSALTAIAREIARLEQDDEEVTAIVVGWPRRLDGSAHAMTARVEAVAAQLRARMKQPVILQDERLSSREAEERLAIRDKDWRSRKRRLDAAAAAVILQDYLDSRPSRSDA